MESISINCIEFINEEINTVDLSLEGDHDFFVSGNNDKFVLSHNCDFEHNDKVKEWILNKYPNDTACISSYSTFHVFGLLKDLGRVYDIEDPQYWNQQTKLIRKELEYKEDVDINNLNYDDAINNSETFLNLMKDKDLKRDMKILMGKYRHVGRHAAGIIISENLIKNQPIMTIKGQNQTSLTEGMQDQTLSKFGFIKIDILGLKTLKVIHETVQLVSKRTGIKKVELLSKIHPDNIELKLDEIFKNIFDNKNLCGIFQFDTPSAIQAIEKIEPDSFDDLVAINALNRPGPKQFIGLYADRKKGKEKVKYLDKRLKPILKNTMGIMCVEENSLIAFSDGFHKKIKDVNIGDEIKTVNEKKNTIENNFIINKFSKKDVGYKLILENGYNIIVTKDHKIFTQNGMKELQKLDKNKDFVCVGKNYNHSFKNKHINKWLGKNIDVAYLVGYMIGNGCLTSTGITICTGTKKQHEVVFDFIKNNFKKLKARERFHTRSYYIDLSNDELLNDRNYGNRKTKFHKIIEDLGLKKINKIKRVPEILFHCSSEVQFSLINGIIDSDGTLVKTKSGKEYYSICSSSKFLLEDIRQILLLNGINSRIGKEENRIYFSEIKKFNPKIKKHSFKGFSCIYDGVYDRKFLVDFKNSSGLSERDFEKKYNIKRQMLRSKYNFVSYNCINNILDLRDVRFYRIKDIKKVGYKNFYDLSLEKNHNYLANGIFVSNCYQEQVMQISRDIAGYTLEEANVLRKAMGKKIKELMEEQEIKFIAGCIDKGLEEKRAKKLFDQIKEFASYSFNLAHAVAYAMIAYQCAYLKTLYSLEFYTALLRIEEKEKKIDKIIKEAMQNGIKIRPLDIRKSGKTFDIIDDQIYYGFCNIKGIGEKAGENVVKARGDQGINPFFKFRDFLLNDFIDWRVCNKKIVEILINSFVFGRNIEEKQEFFKWYQLAKGKNKKNTKEEIYKTTFKNFKYMIEAKELKLEYLTDPEKMKIEKTLYGTNLSLSPFEINGRLNKINKLLKREKSGGFKDSFEYFTVQFKNLVIRQDKNSNDMAFLDIEDIYGEIMPAIIFSSNLNSKNVIDGNVYCIRGDISDKFLIEVNKNIDKLFENKK